MRVEAEYRGRVVSTPLFSRVLKSNTCLLIFTAVEGAAINSEAKRIF